MLVPKQVLPGPGVYWYTDQETGLPRKIRFTSEGIRHLFEQGKAMLAAGLSIPVPIEHQPDAAPLTASERAAWRTKNNGGFVKNCSAAVRTDSGSDLTLIWATASTVTATPCRVYKSCCGATSKDINSSESPLQFSIIGKMTVP